MVKILNKFYETSWISFLKKMESNNILFASSKSQSLIVPLAAPAATNTSDESKLTESIPLECPDRLCKR